MKLQHVAIGVALLASLFAFYRSLTPAPQANVNETAQTENAAANIEKWMVVESEPERTDPAKAATQVVRQVVISPEGELLAIPERYQPFFQVIEEGQEVTNAPLSMSQWKRTGNVRDDEHFMTLWRTGYTRAVMFDEPHVIRGITFYVVR